MKITKVMGRELFNAEGVPALSCEIMLDNGTLVSATVPTDQRMEQDGFFVVTDGGNRCNGLGLQKAVQMIETVVAPVVLQREPDLVVIDALLSELDGTVEKQNLGANVMLAVSMAACKAQALAEEVELFEAISHIQGATSVSLPFPLLTVMSGEAAICKDAPFQGLLLVPIGAQNFRVALEYALSVFHTCKMLLKERKKVYFITEDGGIAAPFDTLEESFALLKEALVKTGLEGYFVIGLDVGADRFFNSEDSTYDWGSGKKTTDDLLRVYKELCENYPLYSIENGLSWKDLEGNEKLFDALGTSIQIVIDEGFIHSSVLLRGLAARQLNNASLIRLSSAPTVTDLLESISFCQNQGMNVVLATNHGETEELFLADLAVGSSSGQIKAGGGVHSQHLAKYNRLLCIEDLLALDLLHR